MSSTKINLNQLDGNIYTQDNLVAGTNISLTDKTINSSNSVQSTNVKTMLALSQTVYDALTTKDPNTFYVIVEDSDESL